MKKIHFALLLFLSATMILLGSCSSGRSYYAQPAPYYRGSVSLILNAGPGFYVERYPDGRYFYRSPEGYRYWRGWDNRYYLDRSYINRVHYNQREYNEWNHSGRGYHRRRYH